MTGFRVSRSGQFGLDGVRPDLMTFGKVMGGGFPAAAFGGTANLMQHLAPVGAVYQAGTLSGNPIATAAGLATLRLATAEIYERIDRTAASAAGRDRYRLACGRCPVRHSECGELVQRFLRDGGRDSRAGLRYRRAAVHRRVCGVLSLDARVRCLPAAERVRSLVSFRGAR